MDKSTTAVARNERPGLIAGQDRQRDQVAPIERLRPLAPPTHERRERVFEFRCQGPHLVEILFKEHSHGWIPARDVRGPSGKAEVSADPGSASGCSDSQATAIEWPAATRPTKGSEPLAKSATSP